MTEISRSTSGKAFAEDLRKVREARGITVDQLHDETKIPRGLIESFEDTGLIDHPMFNRVYLRSFVRTYAEVVGISPDVVLTALDESIGGHYRGRLAVEYLGAEPVIPVSPPAPVDENVPDSPAVQEPPPPVEARVPPPRKSAAPPVVAPPPSPSKEQIPASARPGLSEGPAQGTSQPIGRVRDEERLRPAAPVISASVPMTRRTAKPPVRRREGRSLWIWIGAGVVVLAVAAWLLFSNLGGPGAEEVVTAEPSGTIAVPDAAGLDTAGVAPGAPAVAVGDSIDVTIVAARGPVQNIKVTVDDDLRRPYWIEEGQSQLFQAAQQIVIERQLPKVDVLLEGRPYPNDSVDDQGRIVITRDSAEQFLRQTP